MRCPGSSQAQYADWLPDDKGYPGAAVCIECSLGIQFRRSPRPFKDEEGRTIGVLKSHKKPKE